MARRCAAIVHGRHGVAWSDWTIPRHICITKMQDVEGPGWQKALDTLSQPPFDKPTFKKTFNAVRTCVSAFWGRAWLFISLSRPANRINLSLHTTDTSTRQNQYADTIYRPTSFNGYTDTPPSSQQSIQYLYRNEILTNLEELREELRCGVLSD